MQRLVLVRGDLEISISSPSNQQHAAGKNVSYLPHAMAGEPNRIL